MNQNDNNQYSIFLNEKRVDRNNTLTWVKELMFYCGDLTDLNENDWRICEVPGKRKKVKFLGLSENLNFPIEYPIKLTNGLTIEKY